MAERERRLSERVLDPAFLEGLEDRPLDELKHLREEAHEAETELSFERRLCQARIDILRAELERRAGGGDSDLLARLPEILGAEGRGGVPGAPLPSRAPDFSIPRNADVPRRRVEEVVGERTLARLGQLSPEEIQGIVTSLQEHEREVSGRRKRTQEVMDRIQAAMVPRFQELYPNAGDEASA